MLKSPKLLSSSLSPSPSSSSLSLSLNHRPKIESVKWVSCYSPAFEITFIVGTYDFLLPSLFSWNQLVLTIIVVVQLVADGILLPLLLVSLPLLLCWSSCCFIKPSYCQKAMYNFLLSFSFGLFLLKLAILFFSACRKWCSSSPSSYRSSYYFIKSSYCQKGMYNFLLSFSFGLFLLKLAIF